MKSDHNPLNYRLQPKTLETIAKNIGITPTELKTWSLCRILNHIKTK